MSQVSRRVQSGSTALDRRYEAIVLVGDAIHRAESTASRVRSLVDAGTIVAVIGSASLEEMAFRLGADRVAHGVLMLFGAGGQEIAVADPSGMRRLTSHNGV